MASFYDTLLQARKVQEAAGMMGQPMQKSAWDIAPFSSPQMAEYEAGLPFKPTPDMGVGYAQGPDPIRELADITGAGTGQPDEQAKRDAQNDSVRRQIQEFINQQKGDISAQSELQKRYAGIPQQLDLSPLAALTDAWSGSKFAQTYKAPESQQEKIKAESAFQELQRKGRGDIVDALSKQLFNKGYLDQLRMNATQGRSDRAYDLKTREDLFKAFEGNKTVVASKEALAGVGNARALLNAGTPVSDEAFKTALARASGEKGPLSDYDVKKYAGSPAAAAAYNRMWAKYTTGRLTDADRKDFGIVIDTMERRQRGLLENEKNRFITKVAPNVYRVKSEDAKEILGSTDIPSMVTEAGSDVPAGVDPADWNAATPEQRAEFLKSR